jgi:hypothetical protein
MENSDYIKHYSQLKGKTVKGLTVVEDDEASGLGDIYGLEFTDGTIAWIQRDEEGNGAGFLDISITIMPRCCTLAQGGEP